MAINSNFTVQSAMLAALWTGIGGFVLFHTVLLLLSGDYRTRAMFRTIWFGGLAVAVATGIYLMLGDRDADGL